MSEEKRTLSCTDCGVLNCHKRNASYPEFCLTEKLTDEDIAETTALYEDEENRKVSVISAEIEGEFYGKYTRVDEIIEFAKRMGYKKIGIATCVGLIEESRIFAKILRKNGFDVYSAVCKVGSFNKTDIGLDEKYTCVTGNVMCNPILQAKLLNKAGTDLNVVIGLCVGHDSLFYKYSEALSTIHEFVLIGLGRNTVSFNSFFYSIIVKYFIFHNFLFPCGLKRFHLFLFCRQHDNRLWYIDVEYLAFLLRWSAKRIGTARSYIARALGIEFISISCRSKIRQEP